MAVVSTNGSNPWSPIVMLRRVMRWLATYWKKRVRPPTGSGQNGGYTDQW